MALIHIPNNGDFASVSKLFVEAQQHDADALSESVEITLDANSFLKVDGMAYLMAKCLNLSQSGTKISLGGDYSKIGYLHRFIAGRDIADILIISGYNTRELLEDFLEAEFPRPDRHAESGAGE